MWKVTCTGRPPAKAKLRRYQGRWVCTLSGERHLGDEYAQYKGVGWSLMEAYNSAIMNRWQSRFFSGVG